jgi:hypothetical protein
MGAAFFLPAIFDLPNARTRMAWRMPCRLIRRIDQLASLDLRQ